ncbi:MAG: UbiA family prenyltransferase [Planctomycetes bacterium]|nr:UbiA family prenyltransferase [Planctomycetota bacterium]
MSAFATLRTWGDMIKFSHSVFALPFALVATFLAGRNMPGGTPTLFQFALIVICMVAARSFAMTFNRIADAKIDARNPRTESRPIPAGKITTKQAWSFLQISGLVFLAGCAGFFLLYGNEWPLLLAVPTLALLAGYSYAKRFTLFAHFVLGAAIAFAPTAAWLAIHPATLGLPAILLTGAVLSWIAGFDIIYACQDTEIDRRDGLHSIPSKFGIARALWISRASHVITAALLVVLGLVVGLGWLYWAGLGVTALLLAFEQSLVRHNDLSKVNMAFFTVNGVVSLLFGLTTIIDALWISK